MERENLDDLARLVRVLGLTLAYGSDGARLAFRYHGLPAYLRREIRNHRRRLARMMAEGDYRLCVSPDLHRASWRYAGQGRYTCEYCVKIDAAQLGLWRVA